MNRQYSMGDVQVSDGRVITRNVDELKSGPGYAHFGPKLV